MVIGASRGLGLLIARELDRQGFRVVIAPEDRDELDRAAEQLRADGARVATEFCDVADDDQVEALVERTETRARSDRGADLRGRDHPGRSAVGAAPEPLHRGRRHDALGTGQLRPGRGAADARARPRPDRGDHLGRRPDRRAAPAALQHGEVRRGRLHPRAALRAGRHGGDSVTCVEPGLMRIGSHLRARFVGNQAREYAWFATAASLPLLTIDAERAAVRIVRGVLGGRAVVTLTPLAVVAPRVDALFPDLTAAVLGLTSRLLPDDPGTPESTDTLEGWEAAEQLRRGKRFCSTASPGSGDEAAERNNEPPGGAATEPTTTRDRRAPRR